MPTRSRGTGSDSEPHPIEIEIQGQSLRLLSDQPEALKSAAARVDAVLEELSARADRAADLRLAIVGALNIAADEEDLRTEVRARLVEIADRAEAIDRRLEQIARDLDG